MDLIRDIRDINSEIDALKNKIADFDKTISKSESVSKKLESYFSSAKVTNAGALNIKGVEKAVMNLTERYNALAEAQDAYRDKQAALLETKSKEEKLSQRILEAQRQSLMSGDQAGAQNLYNQYVEANKAIASTEMELRKLGISMGGVNTEITSTSMELERYENVLNALRGNDGVVSIENITRALREQQNEMIEITADIKKNADAIRDTKDRIANNKIAPENMDAAKEHIENLTSQIASLEDRYAHAAQMARDLSAAAGMNPEGISMEHGADLTGVDMPKVTEEDARNVERAAENMSKYKNSTNDASMSMDDLIKKAATLGGLGYGAHKLVEFGRQVMQVRGEFQQLEVAFSTLLGSQKKADKLMSQLTKTAATTPFDLQSVSRGAKQLLAYGTAADEVNDILIHLGDIAAGLSQPLDALVYLYGTTMVQGRMMTMDLRQFQNRGIPIAEQLAKQFGVAKSEVQGLVSSGRVTAEEFHKAIMAMSSDGGKFAGLMKNQSKTITGQISNIQDNISMMFNEIGKKSEGIINGGLNVVSFLVENYEKVGAAILSLISVYGAYKTALIVTTALEAAKAKIKYVSLTATGKQITATGILTKTLWKQVKAQLAANAAILKSPAGIATMVVAGLALATWGLVKALDAEAIAQKKVNDIRGQVKEKGDNRRKSAEDSLSTLSSETATTAQKNAAYNTLIELVPELTDKYDQLALSQLDATEAQKELNKVLEKSAEKDKFNAVKEAVDSYNKMLETNAAFYKNGGQGMAPYSQTKLNAQLQVIKQLKQEANEYKRTLDEAEYDELPAGIKLSLKNTELYSQEQIQREQTEIANNLYENAKKSWEALNAVSIKAGKTFEKAFENGENVGLTAEYFAAYHKAQDAAGKVQLLKKEVTALNAALKVTSITDVVTNIIAAETEVEKTRKAYAANKNEQTKKDFDSAVANYEEQVKLYKDMTDQQWVATKELNERQKEEEYKSARELENIQNSEYAKRLQIVLKYNQDIEDLEREKDNWKKEHPHRSLPTFFTEKEKVIEAEYRLNLSKADKEFNEWIDEMSRETIRINAEIDMSEAERQLDTLDDYATKRKGKNAIYEERRRQKESDLDIEEKKTAKEQFGEKTLQEYNAFVAAGRKVVDSNNKPLYSPELLKTFEMIDKFYEEFKKKREATLLQMESDHSMEIFDEDLQRYEEYVQGIIEAEEEYQNTLAQIRSERGLREDADIETNEDAEVLAAKNVKNRKIKQIEAQTGISGDLTKLDENAEGLTRLGVNVADKTREGIEKAYAGFIDQLSEDISQIDVDITNIKVNIPEYLNELTDVQQQLKDQNIDQAKKEELLKRELELRKKIALAGSPEMIEEEKTRVQDRLGELATKKAAQERKRDDEQSKADNALETYGGGSSEQWAKKAEHEANVEEANNEIAVITEEEAVLSQYLADLTAARVADESQLNDLYVQRNSLIGILAKATADLSKAMSTANNTTKSTATNIKVGFRESAAIVMSLKDSAVAVANAFGSVLPEKSKKALDTIVQFADFGANAITSIGELVDMTSQGMIKTTATASNAMQSLEKASVILAIISIAVQLAMKIAEIISQFTPSAKLQETIDKHLDNVANLKRGIEKLNNEYEDETGIDYYLGMARAAKGYNEVLKEQNDALDDARAKLKLFVKGSDKYEEALQQVHDIEDDIDSTMDEQKEKIATMLEELATTNLFSFSQSLAEAVVEGFDEGIGGVEEAFEDTLDNLYRAMLTKQLSMAFEKQFEDVFKEIEKLTSNENNAFDQSEIDYIMGLMDEAAVGAEEIAEIYYRLFAERGLLDNADTEASEGFGQMTQDQADTLTARFTAVQIEMSNVSAATQVMAEVVNGVGADIKLGLASIQSLLYNSNIALQIAQDQLDHLQVIADNTAMLSETNTRLKAIEQNTDRL